MEVSEVCVTFSEEVDVGLLVVMGIVKLLALLVGVRLFVEMVTGIFVDFSVEIEDGVFVVMD